MIFSHVIPVIQAAVPGPETATEGTAVLEKRNAFVNPIGGEMCIRRRVKKRRMQACWMQIVRYT